MQSTSLPAAVLAIARSAPCQWQMLASTTTPGPLQGQVMAADPTGTILMATGSGGGFGYNNAVWIYSGGNWTAAATGPSGRWEAHVVYDVQRGRWVLYGGWTSLFSIGFGNDETWEFDGTSWRRIVGSGPGDRSFGMAYDAADRQIIRYGGNNHLTETRALGATSSVFGTDCTGSYGAVPLTPSNAPHTGQNYTQILANLNPNVPLAAGVLSLTKTAPTPLDSIGMTGCTAYLTPDLLPSLIASAGSANWDIPIAANPSLVGTSLFAQALSIDPGANPARLVSSNATEGVVGL
ncbi:MAG TPA: hypothetical protein ENI87_06105 [bacterium]|nr:hypothetical protein [bacterium]